MPRGILLRQAGGCLLTYVCIIDMLICMRTTLNLDEELMRQVRRRAADSGQTLTQIIESALRDSLARAEQKKNLYKLKWGTVAGRLRPGVDLADRDSLIDRMEERE